MHPKLNTIFQAIDNLNAQDPKTRSVNGEDIPACLLYGQRMSAVLNTIAPEASTELQIAVRAQHIGRWLMPRSDYPEGRAGYLKWRTQQAVKHAETTTDFMQKLNFSDEEMQRVTHLLRKKDLKNDSETQKLEDTACLVFLTYEIEDFITDYPREKVISILQKTWGKMSNDAQQRALKLDLSPRALELVTAALKGE